MDVHLRASGRRRPSTIRENVTYMTFNTQYQHPWPTGVFRETIHHGYGLLSAIQGEINHMWVRLVHLAPAERRLDVHDFLYFDDAGVRYQLDLTVLPMEDAAFVSIFDEA
ncbi:hypothetical protein LTR85_009355 [Meristemomyces frigidus]|nr:hypothetical protein LTR85_009355 [Meristemomyces frigidus]